jgi:solute carrier family 25 (mitochondrial citrate transporter), member 1
MIVRRETPLALYKGLGAVLSGIVPKMAIRFASFETYKGWLADPETGKTPVGSIFLGAFYPVRLPEGLPAFFFFSAGLGAGTTEAVLVVNPMEVVKIRLQAQMHSLADPLETPQYRNAGHAVYKLVREEGFSVLYRGVTLTALRQATNQGVSAVYVYMTQIDHRCRRKFHRLSRAEEICTSTTARAVRPSDLSAHDYWPHIRCYGTIF